MWFYSVEMLLMPAYDITYAYNKYRETLIRGISRSVQQRITLSWFSRTANISKICAVNAHEIRLHQIDHNHSHL